jgi:hypothetical protein
VGVQNAQQKASCRFSNAAPAAALITASAWVSELYLRRNGTVQHVE